jgi:hypothetical protein
MKKTALKYFCAVFFLVMSGAGETYADKNNCTKCHIIFIKQLVSANNGKYALSQNTLLGKTCWDCHSKDTDNNIDPVTGAPQINHKNDTDLAGGNFAYITGSKMGITGNSMSRGHNIIYTGVPDLRFYNYPPGDEHDNSAAGLDSSTFRCAGKFGCHGDRTIEDEYASMKNTHHYASSSLSFGSIDMDNQALSHGAIGEQVGSSYRFLKGVKGGEDPDWHATSGQTDHNEYYGATSMKDGSRSAPAGNTISGLCAECHGDFHGSEIGMSGRWIRHPTDISLPNQSGTEVEKYVTYNLNVPVARTVIPQTPSSVVNPAGSTDDIVMCLSCHVAHASQYENMLRFDYRYVGEGNSSKTGDCLICHSSKGD